MKMIDGDYIPVMFSEKLIHSEVFRGIRDRLAKEMKIHPAFITVHGAGFCHIASGTIQVHGASSSLGITSKPGDAMLLEMM